MLQWRHLLRTGRQSAQWPLRARGPSAAARAARRSCCLRAGRQSQRSDATSLNTMQQENTQRRPLEVSTCSATSSEISAQQRSTTHAIVVTEITVTFSSETPADIAHVRANWSMRALFCRSGHMLPSAEQHGRVVTVSEISRAEFCPRAWEQHIFSEINSWVSLVWKETGSLNVERHK